MMRAFYESATGRLLAIGSDDPPLRIGISMVDIGDYNVDSQMWDAGTRQMTARPPKILVDRLQDMITDSAYSADLIALWNALNATNRTRLRNGLIRLLGGARWRGPAQPITIEPGG
jgi:hypothetical protein